MNSLWSYLFQLEKKPIFLPTARRKEAHFTLLKQEGNSLVKKGHFQEALEKYSECLAIKPDECALHTNRYEKTTQTDARIDWSLQQERLNYFTKETLFERWVVWSPPPQK